MRVLRTVRNAIPFNCRWSVQASFCLFSVGRSVSEVRMTCTGMGHVDLLCYLSQALGCRRRRRRHEMSLFCCVLCRCSTRACCGQACVVDIHFWGMNCPSFIRGTTFEGFKKSLANVKKVINIDDGSFFNFITQFPFRQKCSGFANQNKTKTKTNEPTTTAKTRRG